MFSITLSQKKFFAPQFSDEFMFLIYHYHTHGCLIKFLYEPFLRNVYFHLQFCIIIIIDSCTIIRCVGINNNYKALLEGT